MAQSFDTVGWFARDPTVLRQVDHILLQLPYTDVRQPWRILVAEDCFKLSDVPQEQHAGPVIRSIQKLLGRQVLQNIHLGEYLERTVPSLMTYRAELKITGSGLDVLRDAMRLLQIFEFKSNHEEWVNSTKPDLAPDIGARVKAALGTSSDLVPLVQKIGDECRQAMNDLLKNEAVLVLPTVSGAAPKLKSKNLDDYRIKVFALICIAGMSGCCQAKLRMLQLECHSWQKHGDERFLLDTALALHPTVQEEAKNSVASRSATAVANGKNDRQRLPKKREMLSIRKVTIPMLCRTILEPFGWTVKMQPTTATELLRIFKCATFDKQKLICSKAITVDKKNVKALLRRGTTREFLNVYREGDEDFRQALVLEPTNKQAVEAGKRLKKLLYE